MNFITFERGGPKFSNTTARVHSCAAASVESKVATMQHNAKNIMLHNICPQLTLLHGCAPGECSSGGI